MKLPFADDSNKLDKNFYTELLHIIGLEEIKDKSKLRIDRKAEGRRDAGSLIENAITIIKTEDLLPNVANIEVYGETREERIFNIALDLCLTWINRVLFLKLLEAQLVDYHNGNQEFRFLDAETIKDFDGLYRLFHQVLAINFDERISQVKEKFRRVPYLNSSLFEFTDLEKQTLKINSLNDTESLNLLNTTVLKEIKSQRGELPTLEYLFKFLDAYDFASEGREGIKENKRDLINASVLGKVFEKINGYKDGSIYTPGFITMYMCRQAIRLAVVQKFKDKYELDIDKFEDLENYVGRFYKTADILEFNELINSLHLCDPAVGSGHFLVSSLNEIIAIKSELKILADENGKTFPVVKITVENDELVVFDEQQDQFFKYQIKDGKPATGEAQRLQKTLFHEKQKLIENCLFGVDINPNSVKICRLRLWIELLKNAYYKESANFAELETLPNIDINIKEGNSLLSRFTLDADLSKILKQIKYSIEDYRNFVLGYKETRDREKKREFEAKIKQIKDEFKTQLFFFSPERRKLADLENQLKASESKQFLFGETDTEKAARFKDEETLRAKITKAKETVQQIEENVIYKNAFEWRFEFPEVLDDDGNFTGFDIVIGNPPYIKEDENKKAFEGLRNKECYQGKMDIWYLFGCLGLQLTKENAYLSFIATNNWVTNFGASKLRNTVIKNSRILNLIDFGAYMIFENASIQTMIMLFKNNSQLDNYTFDYRRLQGEKLNREDVFNLLDSIQNENLILLCPTIKRENFIDKLFTFNTNENSEILDKIKKRQNFHLRDKANKKLNLKAEIGSGIDVLQDFVSNANVEKLNGRANVGDGVFVLSQNEFDEINFNIKEREIIKPYFTTEQLHKYYGSSANTQWIIYTKSNINKLDKDTKKIPINDYPKVKEHLDKFKNIITSDFKPYGLHRTREQHLFESEKIFALRKCPKEPRFTYSDYDCFVSRAFLVIQSDRINLKFLTALFNSKLVAFWLRNKGKMQGNAYQIDKEPLFEIPIYKPSEKDQQPFVALVDQILELKKADKDTQDLENEIDRRVYRLYDLTAEEIAIVEGTEK